MTKLSISVATTSSTLRCTRSAAGSAAVAAPAKEPARIIAGTSAQPGNPSRAPMKAAAIAPASSCPSAPMFQNLARKATATASPVSTSGAALTTVSTRLKRLPSAPANKAR